MTNWTKWMPSFDTTRQAVRQAPCLFALTTSLPLACCLIMLVLIPFVRERWSSRQQLCQNLEASSFAVEDCPPDAGPGYHPDPVRDSLQMVEDFLKARLVLASEESVGLAIDITGSVVSLELGGVPVRLCTITRIRSSTIAAGRLGRVADEPVRLLRSTATIPKQPVRIVEAPRDTAEANRRPPALPPDDSRSAYVILELDHGINVLLRPRSADVTERGLGMLLTLRERFLREIDTARSSFGAGDAAPPVWLLLELSPADIRAVYRALPDGAGVAFRI